MHLFNRSRSAALWLIIILGVTFAQAQNSADNIDNSNGDKETKSVSVNSQMDFSTGKNKTGFGKTGKNFFSASKTLENGGEYKKQTEKSNRELGFYAGSFTFHKDLKGESQKAPVVLLGVRYAWTTKNNPSHRLRYYMDFNPLIIVNYRERRPVQVTPTTTAIVGNRKTVFGVGLQFNWRNSRKFQPFIAGGFGVAVFNKKFPDNRSPLQPDKIGNRFQLMPEFGAGVEIRTSETKSYFVGYKYHHLSNGYTAPLNVGYNTNMIYGGMYLQRGK